MWQKLGNLTKSNQQEISISSLLFLSSADKFHNLVVDQPSSWDHRWYLHINIWNFCEVSIYYSPIGPLYRMRLVSSIYLSVHLLGFGYATLVVQLTEEDTTNTGLNRRKAVNELNQNKVKVSAFSAIINNWERVKHSHATDGSITLKHDRDLEHESFSLEYSFFFSRG